MSSRHSSCEFPCLGRRRVRRGQPEMRRIIALGAAAFLSGFLLWRCARPHAERVTLSVWSHEADEPGKVALRERVAREIERAHPGIRVKISWYDAQGLIVALKTALPAGQGPDLFYIETDWSDLITDGYVL